MKVTVETKGGVFLGQAKKAAEIAFATYDLLAEADPSWHERVVLIKGRFERRRGDGAMCSVSLLEYSFQVVLLFPPYPFSSGRSGNKGRRSENRAKMVLRRPYGLYNKPLFLAPKGGEPKNGAS